MWSPIDDHCFRHYSADGVFVVVLDISVADLFLAVVVVVVVADVEFAVVETAAGNRFVSIQQNWRKFVRKMSKKNHHRFLSLSIYRLFMMNSLSWCWLIVILFGIMGSFIVMIRIITLRVAERYVWFRLMFL